MKKKIINMLLKKVKDSDLIKYGFNRSFRLLYLTCGNGLIGCYIPFVIGLDIATFPLFVFMGEVGIASKMLYAQYEHLKSFDLKYETKSDKYKLNFEQIMSLIISKKLKSNFENISKNEDIEEMIIKLKLLNKEYYDENSYMNKIIENYEFLELSILYTCNYYFKKEKEKGLNIEDINKIIDDYENTVKRYSYYHYYKEGGNISPDINNKQKKEFLEYEFRENSLKYLKKIKRINS